MAGVHALRLMLRVGPVEVRYVGDRMAPALRHGAVVRVRPIDFPLRAGAVVLASVEGSPDLLRVARVRGERVLLRGDADPAPGVWMEGAALLAAADVPARRPLPGARALRRAGTELGEACCAQAEARDGGDVRAKYEAQAPFYVASDPVMDPSLMTRARAVFSPGGKVLVAGSGVGTECFALAATMAGAKSTPHTSYPAAARVQAQGRSLRIRFEEGDLRARRAESRMVPPGASHAAMRRRRAIRSWRSARKL